MMQFRGRIRLVTIALTVVAAATWGTACDENDDEPTSVADLGSIPTATYLIGESLYFQANSPSPAESYPIAQGLYTSGRDHLAICVEEISDDEPDPAVSAVERQVSQHVLDAMPLLALDGDWLWAAGTKPTEIRAGCGATPAPLYNEAERFPNFVLRPGPFKVYVFVLGEQEAHISSRTLGVAGEEKTGGGDSFSVVTYGLYVTKADAADLEYLRSNLALILGLE